MCSWQVVEVKPDESGGGRPKVGCSIKLVTQSDGTDLDPNFLKYKTREEGGGGGPRGRQAVGANAGASGLGSVLKLFQELFGHILTERPLNRGYC